MLAVLEDPLAFRTTYLIPLCIEFFKRCSLPPAQIAHYTAFRVDTKYSRCTTFSCGVQSLCPRCCRARVVNDSFVSPIYRCSLHDNHIVCSRASASFSCLYTGPAVGVYFSVVSLNVRAPFCQMSVHRIRVAYK